uniref:Uncharacterized protein n=1 Tax=Tanacetum cinerariifolium TaxID=118510 RepID=A0A6L2K3N1_TANCI|nr:hypothetical protein [Tanacetum cinerariifolium]
MDEALVPHAQRLRIGRSNFCLLSDIKSKESTLQLVEHKNTKKSNEMYYPRFTKVIIHHFMSKDPSIPRRNKVNWKYVRDDHMLSTIKLVSRHQNTQQFSALLPIELINEEIRNSNAYKEYYAIATGAAPPKPKASVRKTRSSFDTSITPPTVAAGPRLTASAKSKQAAKASKTKSLSALSEGDDDDEKDEGDDGEEGDDDDDDDDDGEEETREEESFDPFLKTPKNNEDEGNGEEELGLNVGREEEHVEEEEEDELYRDVNINQGRGIQATLEVEDSHVTLTPINPDGQQQSSSVSSQFVTSMLNPTLDVGMESLFETTSQMDVQTPTSVAPLPLSAPTLIPSTIDTITTTSQAPILPTTASSSIIQDLPNFGSLFGFDNRLRTLEANFFEFRQTNQFAGASDRLCDEAQRENDEFLKTVDENIKKIIKEKVKEQVKVQVSKILPRIEQAVNEQLEAEVFNRSSHSSKTSYAVVVDLSDMELKKILIEKIEGNKSIQRSDEQRNLYKALVEAYESKKIILDIYEETVTLKRRRDDDADKDEEPSAGPDRGSKRRREGKEPESASAPTKIATRSASRLPLRWKSPHIQSLIQVQMINRLYNPLSILNGFLNNRNHQLRIYPHNLLKPLPLILNNQGRYVIPFEHFINNDLEYLRGGASSQKYTTSVTKTKAVDYGHIKWIEDLVPGTMWIEEPIGYDKHALWGVSHWGVNVSSSTVLLLTEMRRDDDKLYKFKEGDFKRLHIQDIEDMLLLLVQGKLTNLTVEERFAFNVSLRMFTRSIVIQRRVEDLQLGNKDKKNRLMRIDELHKFSDRTLTDVCTALDDRLKEIRM